MCARTYCAALLLTFGVSAVHAQFSSAFEPPSWSATPAGVVLEGQNGFYLPDGALLGARCYTYAGNTLGIQPNPTGGQQFVACRRGTADYARTQRDVATGEGCWLLELDFYVTYTGALPTQNYAGSVSLQPYPGEGSFVILFYWDDVSNAERFSVRALGFAEDGTIPLAGGIPVDAPGFRGRAADRWYRLSLQWNRGLNRVVSLALCEVGQDEDAAARFSPQPGAYDGYYLGGGAAGGAPPTAIRFFAGGGFVGDPVAGNTLAVDNVGVAPAGIPECPGDLDENGVTDLTDLAVLLSNYGRLSQGAFARDGDVDCDGDVDADDLNLLLNRFGIFC